MLNVALIVTVGIASHYAPMRMDEVIEARQAGRTSIALPATLPRVDGYAASVSCADIGDVWLARPVGRHRWDRVLITDCASDTDRREADGLSGRDWMVRNGIVLETGYRLAQKWGCVGRPCEIEILRKVGVGQ